jgi:hypothetical protein
VWPNATLSEQLVGQGVKWTDGPPAASNETLIKGAIMSGKEKEMLTKMDYKLDEIGKKLDGHLSEHFKMRLVIYTGIAALVISIIM